MGRVKTIHRDRRSKSELPVCNYCGKTGKMTTKVVIHKYDRNTLAHTTFTVCADKPCGGYLQMAYEG
jgi:hypothetical protein